MKILITGAGGGIGRHLVRHLRERYSVAALCRRPPEDPSVFSEGVELFLDDLAKPSRLHEALRGVETVIHLAGIKGKSSCESRVREAIAVNVQGTALLAEAARKAGVRNFLFASTYGVYGRRPASELPSREEDEVRPVDLYSMTKTLAERIVQAELEGTVLRIGHVYTSDFTAKDPDVIHCFLRSALRERVIHVRGTGRLRIDPIHIDDLCECILRLLSIPPAGRRVLNIASGSALTLREIAEAVRHQAAELGGQVSIVHEGADDPEEFDRVPAIDQLLGLIPGFRPRSCSQGIRGILTQTWEKELATPIR